MATAHVTSDSVTATLEAASSPKIYNVSIATANTEVSQALSSNTKKITIIVRGTSAVELKIAFVSGESGTKFFTIPPFCSFEENGIDFTGTVYMQASKGSQTVEILEWT